MPAGLSIHIGLNAVDPSHYDGWSGPLNACVNDAKDMAELATGQGFDARLLLDHHATRTRVITAISEALDQLGSGDMLLVTYSGHGGQIDDWNGDEEGDGMDETWCLHDGQLVDDELWRLWVAASEGVRIVVVSDSCHSGSVTKLRANDSMTDAVPEGARCMPLTLAARVYRKHRAFYDEIGANPAADLATLRASVLLLSGCQDDQYSYDGVANGRFTAALLGVWGNGAFTGDYRELHGRVRARVGAIQTPNLFLLGPASGALVSETPFTI